MFAIKVTNTGITQVKCSANRNGVSIGTKKMHLLREIDKFKVYSEKSANTPFSECLDLELPNPLDEYVLPSVSYWVFENCNLESWQTYLTELSTRPCEKRVISSVTLPNFERNDEEFNSGDSSGSEEEEEDLDESNTDTEEDEGGEDTDNEEIDVDDGPEYNNI